MMKRASAIFLALGLLAPELLLPMPAYAAEDDGRFDSYEIRVIRPRQYAKRQRFELGAELSVIMNQTFIYTYLATGILTFHFTEEWAIQVTPAYGVSFDKEDKRLLKDEFNINTEILRTAYFTYGSILWTPMYGKYQLASGKLIYYDTYLGAGGGITGIQYNYDHCVAPSSTSVTYLPKPEPRTVSYPTIALGVGQRYRISDAVGISWQLLYTMFAYDLADGACDPTSGVSGSATHQNVTMQLGASRFF